MDTCCPIIYNPPIVYITSIARLHFEYCDRKGGKFFPLCSLTSWHYCGLLECNTCISMDKWFCSSRKKCCSASASDAISVINKDPLSRISICSHRSYRSFVTIRCSYRSLEVRLMIQHQWSFSHSNGLFINKTKLKAVFSTKTEASS